MLDIGPGYHKSIALKNDFAYQYPKFYCAECSDAMWGGAEFFLYGMMLLVQHMPNKHCSKVGKRFWWNPQEHLEKV